MATTTRVLDANVNGTVYTSNANDALEALDTCHSGTTAPTDEVANGKLWLDTSTTPGILKIYNNATWEVVHSGTVDINAGTIDGTTIGATTPADVTTSSLVATTADINGGTIDGTVIGGTTPAAVTATALTVTGAATGTDLTLSGGVYLGGTGAANKLDDYEEGTFTPVVSDSSSGGNLATVANVRGVYTKTGNQVTVHFNLNNITTTGMTGGNSLYIQGLPFTAPSYTSPNLSYLGTVRVQDVTFTGSIIGKLDDGGSFMVLQKIVTGTNATDVLVSDLTSVAADINVSLTYETT